MLQLENKVRAILANIVFFIKERKYKKRLKYIYERNNSSCLAIVFPAFPSGERPLYNYYRTLKNVKCDKLFLLDDFGYRGSYLMYDGGGVSPQILVEGLLKDVLSKSTYNRVISLGSSKGGTCAIYYGLKIKADVIYAGACQYYIGTYLNTKAHRLIFEGMMGKSANDKDTAVLDHILPDVISQSDNCHTVIHLFYSKQEHTYQEHIQPLIDKLNAHHIKFEEHLVNFTEHALVGKYFSPFVKQKLQEEMINTTIM